MSSSQRSQFEGNKKTRFRFSEKERLTAIKELFNIVNEDNATEEEEIWINLHQVLHHDNSRFQACSLRLLKEHLLEQVSKFNKYDSEEATENEKQRLKTDWGEAMRMLKSVWGNYELKRRQKWSSKRSKLNHEAKKQKFDSHDTEIAKMRREASTGNVSLNNDDTSLGQLDHFAEENFPSTSQSCNENLKCDMDEFHENNGSQISDTIEIELPNINLSSNNDFNNSESIINKKIKGKRKSGKESTKFIEGLNTQIFLYLTEKNRLEHQIRQKELILKEQQHKDQMKLQSEELEYKKAVLEFEKEKLREDVEARRKQSEIQETTAKLLTAILNSDIIKKIRDD